MRVLYELSGIQIFCNKEQYIRDRLVLGIKDQILSEMFQLQSDFTFDCYCYCLPARSSEATF